MTIPHKNVGNLIVFCYNNVSSGHIYKEFLCKYLANWIHHSCADI